MREMMVDLPQPLGPTKATDLPTGMVKETSLRMGNIEMRGIREGDVGEGDVAVVTSFLIARAASSSLGRLMMPIMFLAARCANTPEGV